jgi:hypothetical protein
MADVEKFVSCWVDEEDDFATANADDLSKVGLAVLEGATQIQAEREALAEDSVTSDHGKWAPVEGSASASTFNFTTRAGGLGELTSPADGVLGAEDTETPDLTNFGPAVVLRSLFGGMVAVAGDLVAASPVPTVAAFKLTAQGTLSTPLAIILVETVDHGLQPVPVAIVEGLCTCLMELPSAPVSATGKVFGSLNFPLIESLDVTKSFQGIFVSDTTGHKYRILGGMAQKVTLNLSARQLPKLSVEALMNSWSVVTTALSSIKPPHSRPWMDATFRMAPVGTTAYNANQRYKVKGDLAFEFGRGLTPEDDPNHAEGASGYDESFDDAFMKFSPILPFSTDWRTNFGLNADKQYHVLAASTRLPGHGMATYARNLVQSEYPKPTENNGMTRIQPVLSLGSGYTQPGCVLTVF